MLMHDINLLLPSAIRTMRSSLRDINRQQIPFTVEGLSRLGLPEKFAERLREISGSAEQERLAVACFIEGLFASAGEDYVAKASLRRWLSTHGGAEGSEIRSRVSEILRAWNEEEFGSGEPAGIKPRMTEQLEERARSSARSFIYRLF